MKLVNCNDSSRRIVDRWRQGLERNIYYDAVCKGRILLHRPFRPESDG